MTCFTNFSILEKKDMIYLNIILTILTLVLISILSFLVFIYKKFGKNFSNISKQVPQLPQGLDSKQLAESMKMFEHMFGAKQRK